MKPKSAFSIYECPICKHIDVLHDGHFCPNCPRTQPRTYVEMIKHSEYPHPTTLYETGANWLMMVLGARELKTFITYRDCWRMFCREAQPKDIPVSEVTEAIIKPMFTIVSAYQASGARLKIQAIRGFLEYMAAEDLGNINLGRLKILIRQRVKKQGHRLPVIPFDDMTKGLNAIRVASAPTLERPLYIVRWLRMKAIVLLLATTGLRRFELQKLRRGDISQHYYYQIKDGKKERVYNYTAVVIGKGNKQGVVRFERPAMMALEAYWAARSALLPASKLPAIERQWAFWSHKKNGKANVQIDIDAIRRDVNDWSLDYAGVLVSPHGLRHYFVTAAVKAGLNIKTVKELARHAQISVTGGYVDLNDTDLDRGYDAIFNKGVRNKAEFEKAMQEQK